MTMYRQMWLAIITSMLFALVGSIFASTLSARAYLSQQLTMKNADNASALALALSQQQPDEVIVELAVSSLFDGGHYEQIRVVDPEGRILIERITKGGAEEVPGWFARSFPIVAQAGQAQISNGWQQFGTITVVSHSRFAYQALWQGAIEMLGALALASLLGGYLGGIVLRRLHRPLNAVIEQASAISERRFITIPEPAVPELRQLASAMNATVRRLKAIFDEEAERLEAMHREVNCDALTGLANRQAFMSHLRVAIENKEADGGALILIRIAQLADINHRLGRDATDELLRTCAAALNGVAGEELDALAARLNGADFALLLPNNGGALAVAEGLLVKLLNAASTCIADGGHICVGAGSFQQGADMTGLLARVDAALAGVEAFGKSAVGEAIEVGSRVPCSNEDWKHLITEALAQGRVCLRTFPVVDADGALVHQEGPLRLSFSADGEWLPAGHFLPMAERLHLTPKLDLAAITLGFDELKKAPALPGLAINLSANSLRSDEFRHAVLALFKEHADLAPRLWIEVAESGVFRNLDAFRSLCADLRPFGCKLGIEHFGHRFGEIGKLHDLGLDYLKVDASFIQGIDGKRGNQSFLTGLCAIAHGIGTKVYAEGVGSDVAIDALLQAKFDGVTGPAVKDPELFVLAQPFRNKA